MAQLPSRANVPGFMESPLSSAATRVPGQKVMVFASEWYFKPDGVQVVKRRFEAELTKLKLVSYSFIPGCPAACFHQFMVNQCTATSFCFI